MLGGDWSEHWMAGGGEDHGSLEDNSRAMMRSHYPLARPHAHPGVRGNNVARLQRV